MADGAESAPPETTPPEPTAPEPGPPAAAPPGPGAGSRLRAEAYAFLEVTALSGIALAQPLLDVIGKSPDFLLFYGAGRRDVLLLVAALVLVPPLVLWGVGALAGAAAAAVPAGGRVRRWAHLVTLGGLAAVLAIQVGKQALPLRGLPLLLLAAAAGAGLALCYRRWEAARRLVRLAAVGPLVFSLLFVFASPASAVVLAGDRAGAAGGGAGDGEAAHPPIVMIVLDELPLLSLLDGAGGIDAERFPNFARLAGDSTWYRNATAVSGYTPRALPAMLTGRYPLRDVAPHYSQYPDNLFTLLRDEYDLRVQESITQLCPPRDCERDAAERGGLPTMLGESAALLRDIVSPYDSRRDPTAGFSEPTVDDSEQEAPTDPKFRWDRLDDNQPVRFRDFLTGVAERPAAGARPAAHVLHLLLPHTPWRYLPSGVRYEAPEDLPTSGPWWPRLAHERHLLQLGYTDRLLGETLDALRGSGQYDDALVVVTADHGVTFARDSVGRGMGHLKMSPAEVMWVPTFVKAPGQRDGVVDDRNWQHVDLLPTVADHAGLAVPWQVDGESARGAPRATDGKRFCDTPSNCLTMTTGDGLGVVTGVTKGFPDLPPGPDLPAGPDRSAGGAGLVGRPVADVGVAGEARGGDGEAVTATVANGAEVAAADPATGEVPALIYGTLPASVPDGAVLAIAVNGRIGAVVPVLTAGTGAPRFAGMVTDTSLFRAGNNALELFLVDAGAGGSAPLRRVSH